MVEIKEFINHLKKTGGRNVHLGLKDFAPSEYPVIQVLIDNPMPVSIHSIKTLSLDISLTVIIVTGKDNIIQALELLEKILKKINQFNDNQGNEIDITVEPEHKDNTFEMNFNYSIKKIITDT